MASSAKRQRRHPPRNLAGHADRLAARRQQRQPWARVEGCNDQRRTGIEQMLAIVQHQQHLAVADELDDRVHRRTARLVGQAQRAGHRTAPRQGQ